MNRATCPKCQAIPQPSPCTMCLGEGQIDLGPVKQDLAKHDLSLLPYEALEWAAEKWPAQELAKVDHWSEVIEPLVASGISNDTTVEEQTRDLVRAARHLVHAAGVDALTLPNASAVTGEYEGRSYGFSRTGLAAVVRVLEHGLTKYARNNWRGLAPHRIWAAMIRHGWEGQQVKGVGLDRDRTIVDPVTNEQRIIKGSGLPHSAHAACCVLFLLTFARAHEVEQKRLRALAEMQRRAQQQQGA